MEVDECDVVVEDGAVVVLVVARWRAWKWKEECGWRGRIVE